MVARWLAFLLVVLEVPSVATARGRKVTLADLQQQHRQAAAYHEHNRLFPPARELIYALYSREGMDASQRLLAAAREHRRQGTTSPFERALLLEVERIKRGRYAPRRGEQWRLWARQRKVNRVPSALLNVLEGALFRSAHPADSLAWHAEEWLDHVRLDKSVVRRRFGDEGLQAVESLLATQPSNAARSAEQMHWLGNANQWTLLNGLNRRMERLLADGPHLAPSLPVVEHELQQRGPLPDTIEGVLVRWPGRANSLAVLRKLGLPEGSVIYGDKVHFLDPRFMLALSEDGYRLRGRHVTADKPFLERWVDRALEPYRKLSDEALARQPVRFLMLDDGGLLTRTVNRLLLERGLDRFAHLFAFVEQTGSGSNLLGEEEPLLFHGIDVARGDDKAIEAPDLFGYVVASQLADMYARLEAQGVTLGKNVAIMGAGKQGRGVGMGAAEHLARADFRVTVHDIDPAALSKAEQRTRDARIAFASEPVEAIKSADAVLTFTGGQLAFGEQTMEALAEAVPEGKTLLVMNGGSPGEIEQVSKSVEERRNTGVDRYGVVWARIGQTKIALGHSDSGPDLDRVVPYGSWHFILARGGQVANGRTRIAHNQPRLRNESRLFEGAEMASRKRVDTENPTPDHLIDEELARLVRSAHLAAQGGAPGLFPLSEQADLKAVRRSKTPPTRRW